MKTVITALVALVIGAGGMYFYQQGSMKQLQTAAAALETQLSEAKTAAEAATGDEAFLAGAKGAAKALIECQLESGGWRNSIDFDPSGPRIDQYRNGKGKGKNLLLYLKAVMVLEKVLPLKGL
jgi:hypothetical protein